MLLLLAVTEAAAAQQTVQYERAVPSGLAAQARVGEDSARAVALARIPGGTVEALELVREGGKLLWSFDIRAPGQHEPTEVNVDAADGTVVRIVPPEQTPILHAGVLSGELKLDGRLDEPAWNTADSIGNLVTIEPREGAVPAGQTVVKVLADPAELVVGVICRDTNPAGIVAFAMARDDSALTLEDHLTIVLDPYRDARTGYVFEVNPNGARFDGLVTAQGEEVNSNWDGVWEARTSRDDRGWTAEVRIPVRSIGFKPHLTTWGFNVERRVQRLQETSRWAGVNRDYEIFQTSQAGLLTDLPEFDLGLGLTVRPALVESANRSAQAGQLSKLDGSLDVTKRLGPNLLSSLTVNTDFGETEVDARQTNLSRFDVFFPEKRTFFLEGTDIFNFGLGTGQDLIPFFSRRIGLVGEEGDLRQVPLTVGGKLNGRLGNSNLGALVVRTRSVDTLRSDATMGVLRLTQNVISESSVGIVATAGDPLARPGSWMGGMDLTYQTSVFRGDKNLLIGAWGLRSHNNEVGGDNAYGAMIDYPNDLWDVALNYKRIGPDFNAALGFVPRTGVQIWQLESAFQPRPGRLARQLIFEFNPSLVTDLAGNWESYLVSTKPLDWEFASGDRLELTMEPTGDRPTQDFDAFVSSTDTVTIPAGTYRWIRYGIQGALADKRRISGEATWSTGSFYDGHLNSIAVTLRVKPSPHLFLELGGERNSARLAGGNFVQRLYSGRVQFNLSPDLQVASFLQYDNESRLFGSNTRLRWTFNPLGDLFIVYNHNLLRNPRNRFGFDSRQLIVKLQRALPI
jgi:hypothetical protein